MKTTPWGAIAFFLLAFAFAVLGLATGVGLLDAPAGRDPQGVSAVGLFAAVLFVLVGMAEADRHAKDSIRNTRN